MFNALMQPVKAGEQELKRLKELSLRIAGVLAAAILVFIVLYLFVASLEVPVIPRRVGLSGRPASTTNEGVTSLRRQILKLRESIPRGAGPLKSTTPA